MLNERLGLITCGKGADTQAPLSRLLGTRVSQAGARCRLVARQDPKIAPTPSPCLLTPAGTPGDRSLPCALGAGVSSRSWVGYSSKATGTKRTAPRTTKPSGRGAASCCLRSRWVPQPSAVAWALRTSPQNLDLPISSARLPSASQESWRGFCNPVVLPAA